MTVEGFFKNKRVLVTGHTGFTGGWLTTWLKELGAIQSGLSLDPPSSPNLFEIVGKKTNIQSFIGDIRDMETVSKVFDTVRPEIVFHLAAQPIVSIGYTDPLGTFDTNVMGTAHVLEAARRCAETKVAVCVTTDKVYQNNEWQWGYREIDPLGGKDPYSASKSAAEMVIGTYQKTLSSGENDTAIAAARGGNIIGGGDWSPDRIVTDFVKAVATGSKLSIRNPDSTRPWQHVLALVQGYLMIAERLWEDRSFATSWNLGPTYDGNKSVRELVNALSHGWKNPEIVFGEGGFLEANFLHLDSTRALSGLGWRPPLSFEQTARWTTAWYSNFYEGSVDPAEFTLTQIREFEKLIREKNG